MKKHQIFSSIVITSWIALIMLGGYFYFQLNISLETAIFSIKDFILHHPIQGILLFLTLYVIRPLFFIIATPFDLFSGMVFGPVYGFFISWFGTFLSSMFSYGVGRIIGGSFIEKKEGKKIKKMKEKLHQDTFFTALMMRLILLPFDLTNYICGTLKAPFSRFVAGTTLGIAPATFVLVSAGSAFYGQEVTSYETLLENIKYENLWFSSGFLITILLVSEVLKRKYKNISL